MSAATFDDVINKHESSMIDNETSRTLQQSSASLCEIYSAVFDQQRIVEIVALEMCSEDHCAMSERHRHDLKYVIDISAVESVTDIRAAIDADEITETSSLCFDSEDTMRAFVADLAMTISY
jgi:hypothetical protein